MVEEFDICKMQALTLEAQHNIFIRLIRHAQGLAQCLSSEKDSETHYAENLWIHVQLWVQKVGSIPQHTRLYISRYSSMSGVFMLKQCKQTQIFAKNHSVGRHFFQSNFRFQQLSFVIFNIKEGCLLMQMFELLSCVTQAIPPLGWGVWFLAVTGWDQPRLCECISSCPICDRSRITLFFLDQWSWYTVYSFSQTDTYMVLS